MSIRIVADSSANLTVFEKASFASVPLTIFSADRQYTDNGDLDVRQMMDDLSRQTGKTSSACPGPGDWLEAFAGAEEIIALPLTQKISGAYNSCMTAASLYREEHPQAKIYVADTLTTGPELELLVEKAADLAAAGASFDDIAWELKIYSSHTHLAFSLESLQNFVRNGRVNPALAKTVEMLHIRIVGRASDVGDLKPMNKCPGRKKAVSQLVANMKELGYRGGRVRIRHTGNPQMAEEMRAALLALHPESDITIGENRGLCAYYTENGGLLIGFEDLA